MKLNLGCGFNRVDGYWNVDKEPQCKPDQCVDLERFPWPWSDNSILEVLEASYDLEEPWLTDLANGKVSEAEVQRAMRSQFNVCHQVKIVMRVVKPARETGSRGNPG